MTAPVSSTDSSSLRIALALQQRMAAADDLRRAAENRMQAKQVDAQARLKQLEVAEKTYYEEMSRPVFVMELEDGTTFEVQRNGGVIGSGPRGALVLGLDDLARKAGFPEPKTQEEAMMQKITVLQLHYGSEEVRDATRKFLDDAKKAIALLSQMVQMLQDGWTSGAIPLTPVKGSDGDDELKIWSSGMRITAGAGDDLIYADRYSAVDAGDGNDTVMAGELNSVDGGAGDDMISARGKNHVAGGAGHDTIRLWGGEGTASGGAGNDVIQTFGTRHTVSGGAGDDVLIAHGGGADGGSGNDVITTHGEGDVTGGTGDDLIRSHGGSLVDGGDGDDAIHAYGRDTVVHGGAGDDLITAYTESVVDGGAGNDVIETYGGTASGGAGDDFISGHGKLHGGDGNDAIVGIGYGTEISGGRGDDQILASEKTSVAFGRGDGRDTVTSGLVHLYAQPIRPSAVTFNLSQGLSRHDMQISVSGNDMTLDFGSGDSITIQDYRNMSATMVFADGSKVRVTDFVASGSPQTSPGRAIDLQA